MTSSPNTPGALPPDPHAALNAEPDTTKTTAATTNDPITPSQGQPTVADAQLSSAVAVQPRPVHPMPPSFPELYLPTEARLPQPVLAPLSRPLPNPHDIHDGHGGYAPEHVTCVRCGSSNLAQGQIVDHGDKFRTIFFAPKRVSLRWLNSLLALSPFRALTKMNAIACRDCGFVHLTIDPSELRRAERRRD